MSVVVPHLLTKEVMVDVGGGGEKIETFTPCMQVIPSGTQEIKTTNHLSSIFNEKYHYGFSYY